MSLLGLDSGQGSAGSLDSATPDRAGLGVFSFKGRGDRRTFWLISIAANIGAALFFFVVVLIASDAPRAGLLLIPLGIVWAWVVLAIQVKRLHDLDQSGWMALLTFAPVISPVALILLAVLEHKAGIAGMGDQGLSIAFTLIGIVNLVVLVVLGFVPGTEGENQFDDLG